jgi:Protein of unknown function (DUF2911)
MKKKSLAIVLMFGYCIAAPAQIKLPPVDKSPMDMSYYPNGYPVLKIQDKVTEPLVARVIFSRPQKNGRTIFGELLEYGKVWRLGANEATEIEFFQNVKIGDARIKKGRYTMYCIPYPEKWTLILNKETDTWGSFKYDESKDAARLDVPVQKQTEVLEAFVMAFDKTPTGAILIIAWDNLKVDLPIIF